MSFDFQSRLLAVSRSVSEIERDGTTLYAVTLARSFPTAVADLWDALTSPSRLQHCFLPVSGDLRLGGRYQFEGNAGGSILECIQNQRIALTWEFAGNLSWLELDFAAEDLSHSHLTLSHICPIDDHWKQYGPGATGAGWDMAMVGLEVYFTNGGERLDESIFIAPEAKKFIAEVCDAWGREAVAAGEKPDQAMYAASATREFYTAEA